MSRVFLCEKPSQARDIALVMGNPTRQDGYISSGEDKVTWCVGHLYELAEPADYDPEYKAWNIASLPIAPKPWKLSPKRGFTKQIAVIRKLLGGTNEVVIATDPDREGEVIAREVLDELHYRGNISRLLLSALDPKSVRKGLASIRSGKETEKLYHAGMGRSRSDWLIGMNLTRACTCVGRTQGIDAVLSVGRVQTSTLALVVARDRAIERFVSQDYFTVDAQCQNDDQRFSARWISNQKQLDTICDSEGRCNSRSAATMVAQALSGSTAFVRKADTQTKRVKAPLPFSLSQLQQAASKKWGYGAKQTLKIAQALYETHKAASYPRTDCQYLPLKQFDEASQVVGALAETFAENALSGGCREADLSIKSRAWNSHKITAHHAIIPTTQPCNLSAMSAEERNVFELIARHYLAQFYPDHIYDQTTVWMLAQENQLRSVGRVIVEPGWHRAIKPKSTVVPTLPLLRVDYITHIASADVSAKKTKPPAHYTEGTLIKAMTNIASIVEDPESKKILRDNDGIGTEATHGDIIQTIKTRKYVKPTGKSLISTDTGRALIDLLPEALTNPVTTAMMERQLSMIASGKLTLDDYMQSQLEHVNAQLDRARHSDAGRLKGMTKKEVKPCPRCSKGLQKRKGKYGYFMGCTGYPDCTYIEKEGGDKPPPEPSDQSCPSCEKPLLKRKGRKGLFLGCSAYPDCTYTAEINQQAPRQVQADKTQANEGHDCPVCTTGKLKRRKGKYGHFWGCSNYASQGCKAIYKDQQGKPV